MRSALPFVLWLAAFAGLFSAAVTDLKTRRIPNGLVLVVLTLGMAWQMLSGRGNLWLALLIAGLVFAIGAGLARMHVIGGGDVKMIAAVTVLFPPAAIPALLVCIALAGGALSLFYFAAAWLVQRHFAMPGDAPPPARDFARIIHIEIGRLRANEPMPYGVAIFAGATSLILIGVLSCISAPSCSLSV